MKTINGKKYSFKKFEGFHLELKLLITDKYRDELVVSIFTNNDDIDKCFDDLMSISTKKVCRLNIIHYWTKNQLDKREEFAKDCFK